ncbi:MAG: DUF3256 family protein [Paludibacter sp.]
MKSLIQLIVAFLIASTSVFSSNTDSIFIKLPGNLIPMLTAKQRYELAEYFKAGKKDSVKNLVGSNSILLKYDTTLCHIIVKTSAIGTTEIKQINLPNNVFSIAIINTISQPIMYSNIYFYDEKWQILAPKIELPSTSSWINFAKLNTSNVEESWIKTLLDKKYYSMKFNDSNELEVQNNVLSTLSMDDRKLAEPYFMDKSIQIQL